MKSIKILPSNGKYAIALASFLILAAGFFTWYNAGGKYRLAYHSQIGEKVVKEDGKLLLWASGDAGPESQWFDMTSSLINPKRFDHGIGKDRIASLDAPEFVSVEDPRFRSAVISMQAPVIGFEFEGEARAYPVLIMNRHEIVNDTFGDTHLTVAW